MELKGTYNIWTDATEINAPTEILTGTASSIHSLYKEYDKFINVITEKGTVLDFGAGVGRNTIQLSKKFEKVYAFDFENMINMLRSTKAYRRRTNIECFTDFDELVTRKVDAIFCSICLQHIYTVDLLNYLHAFRKMSTALYVFTRSYNDHNGHNMFQILTRFWKVADMYGTTLETLKNASGEDHYLIKLSCDKIEE